MMAKVFLLLLFVMIPALMLLSSPLAAAAAVTTAYGNPTTTSFAKHLTTSEHHHHHHQVEKMTALHFYWSDFTGGPNRTILPLTTILDNSTFYGGLFLADDPLTLGPELNSTSVGRGRGLYGFPSRTNPSFEMVYTLAFTLGKYNGSTLSMLGSINPTSSVNELSVVGGTGVFRFARGYVVSKDFLLDLQAQLVVREFHVYVSHY